jgi:hypothetical protein
MQFELNGHQNRAQRNAGIAKPGRQPGLVAFLVSASSILWKVGSEFASQD